MITKISAARDIAGLLNQGKNLAHHIGYEKILSDINEGQVKYLYKSVRDHIIAVVGIKNLEFSIAEIKHIAVSNNYRRRGLAKELVKLALDKINKPVILCTIRESNTPSINLMTSFGFKKVVDFNHLHKLGLFLKLKEPHVHGS
jgi:ribosomal protein S18 acetylase RimI-like enzyme